MKVEYVTGRRLTVHMRLGESIAPIHVDPNTTFVVHALMVWAEVGARLDHYAVTLIVDGATLFAEQYTERLLWSLPRSHCDPRDLAYPAVLRPDTDASIHFIKRSDTSPPLTKHSDLSPPFVTNATVELIGVTIPGGCHHDYVFNRPAVY